MKIAEIEKKFEEYIDRYLVKAGCSANYIKSFRKTFNWFIDFCKKHKNEEFELTEQAFEDFYLYLVKKRKIKENSAELAKNTIKSALMR